MEHRQTCVAVIPARGGSKGIPRKNVALVAGRPLIAYTIEAARAASVVERVIVSTDSAEVADVAVREGAEAPFRRPADLARDDTPGIAVVLHAVRWIEEHEGYRCELVMYLQPTSPLRRVQDIEAAVALLQDRGADAVVSVCVAERHPFWTKRILDDGRLADFFEDDRWRLAPRQALPEAYVLNGAIYLVRRDVLLAQQSFYTDKTYAYVMPSERSLDVDTRDDLERARVILAARGGT